MKRNELKTWAARFVTIGLMTLISACGSNNNNQPPVVPPGGINQGMVGCVPIPMNGMTNTMMPMTGGTMPMGGMGGIQFQATGFSLNSVNLAFGRLPTGQSIGQVQMGMGAAAVGMGGMTYTGSSNATGSSISVSLQSGMVGMVPTTTPMSGNTAQILRGSIYLSSYELQLAGLSQNYMMPSMGGMYPGQYPNNGMPGYNYPQNGTGVMPGAGQTCVSGVGATGALNNAYMKFYGLMQDYVYVYINNGQSYIKFKI